MSEYMKVSTDTDEEKIWTQTMTQTESIQKTWGEPEENLRNVFWTCSLNQVIHLQYISKRLSLISTNKWNKEKTFLTFRLRLSACLSVCLSVCLPLSLSDFALFLMNSSPLPVKRVHVFDRLLCFLWRAADTHSRVHTNTHINNIYYYYYITEG